VGYSAKLRESEAEIVARLPADRAEFIRELFHSAKRGRVWHSWTLDETFRGDRGRVTRALEYMAEQGWVELTASDARQRYSKTTDRIDVQGLADELELRFVQRERAEVERMAHVVELVEHDGCQTAFMLRYFGEELAGRCGHCTHCENGSRTRFPVMPPAGSIDQRVSSAELEALVRAHPTALATPRRRARFLCGLSSPALSQAKLTRHPLFGLLEARRFADVLEWCDRA
jgi:ATP-dependent DNA helicase RecQ